MIKNGTISQPQSGFTLIEMILAIAITTIFIAIFVEIGLPVSQKMKQNVKELESYRQLLFVTAFLDDLAHISPISVSTSTNIITSPIATCQTSLIPEIDRGQIFACTFNQHGTTTIPLFNLLEYGTSTITISEEGNGDSQYQMHIGKYILQFGLFPHIYRH